MWVKDFVAKPNKEMKRRRLTPFSTTWEALQDAGLTQERRRIEIRFLPEQSAKVNSLVAPSKSLYRVLIKEGD